MVDPGEPVVAKAVLRQRLLARRRALTAEEVRTAAAAVAGSLVQALAGVGTVAAFVPDRTEPGHGRLPAALAGLGARVLLPVIPPVSRELDWAVDSGRLALGRFGLLEPVGPRLGPDALGTADVIVVPALAADRAGTRLGRGGGYYDTSLVHARPDAVLVALLFDGERVEELPAEAHDRPVTAVVTPSGGWEELPGR